MEQRHNVEKQRVGEKVVELIENNMVVGIGTGSTVYYAIRKLAQNVEQGLSIKAVSTSSSTSSLLKKFGIDEVDINDVNHIDICIDGADEVDSQLRAVKGGGGALLLEKIVAVHSKKLVLIADSTKYVSRLGKFPLPVEIVKFGYKRTVGRLSEQGFNPKIRGRAGDLFITDSGNYIVDLHLNQIEHPAELSVLLNNTPGVVDNGLFIDIAQTLYLADREDVRIVHRSAGMV